MPLYQTQNIMLMITHPGTIYFSIQNNVFNVHNSTINVCKHLLLNYEFDLFYLLVRYCVSGPSKQKNIHISYLQ